MAVRRDSGFAARLGDPHGASQGDRSTPTTLEARSSRQALASSQLLAELPNYDADHIDDDRLRLICTCCHPALAVDAQVALTLRTVCGLEIEEIARALLVSPPTMTKRLVRARQKIRDAAIPYVVPSLADMPGRLASVCTVIYLIFTEGYAATTGEPLVRADLCTEAIRLARLVRTLTAPHPSSEITALLALMLLHDSRRDARVDEHGELVLLEDQDRSRWNHDQIAEALPLVEEALRGHVGPFAIEAAIAALHCSAARPEDTDWRQIVRLYDVLLDLDPSPIASLNRAVAVAMAEGPERGLAIVDDLAGDAVLDAYYPFHAARADLQRRVGALSKAAKSYEKAISLTTNRCERMFLERRLASLRNAGEVEERA